MIFLYPDFHFPPGGVASIVISVLFALQTRQSLIATSDDKYNQKCFYSFILIFFFFFVECTGTASASLSLSVLLMEGRTCVEQTLAFPHYAPKELLSQTGKRKDIEHQEIKCEGISQVLRLVHCRV